MVENNIDTDSNYTIEELLEDSEVMLPTVSNEEVIEKKQENIRNHILTVWKDERAENRKSKKEIYDFLKKVLLGILIFLGVYTILHAFRVIRVEEWTLRLIIISVFGVVASIFTVIVNHMFPKDSDKQFFNFMIKLYTTTNEEENELIEENDI